MDQTMKNVFNFILLMFLSFSSYGKIRYFFADSVENSSKIIVNQFTLDCSPLYAIDKKVELINVLSDSTTMRMTDPLRGHNILILFTILPSFDKNDSLWEEIDSDINKLDLISYRELIVLGTNTLSDALNPLFARENYNVIIKRKNKYFKSKKAFIQFFHLQNLPKELNTPIGTININQSLFSIKDAKQVFSSYASLRNIFSSFDTYAIISPSLERFYLSKIYNLKSHKVYQFWTLISWGKVKDDLSWYRGVDRFAYVPRLGIVGASIDFFFRDGLPKEYPRLDRRNVSYKELLTNISEEKIMIAEELK